MVNNNNNNDNDKQHFIKITVVLECSTCLKLYPEKVIKNYRDAFRTQQLCVSKYSYLLETHIREESGLSRKSIAMFRNVMPDRVILPKYCPYCERDTLHVESKNYLLHR